MDALDTLYRPEYAEGFAVLKAGERSSIVSIKDPWQGAQGVVMNLFLERGGEKPPKGFEGTVVTAPLRRVVCMSSSYVAFIDALGETDAVVGVSGARFIYNKRVQAEDVGYDAAMNYEKMVALNPDLVLIYGVAGENTQITGKLRELGIPYIYIGEYVERLPLGRAEWLVMFGEFFNRRGEASAKFGEVRDNYLRTAKRVSEVEQRPKVMFNAPYRDVWYVPAAGSYMARLVEDAGGAWHAPEGSGETATMSGEEVYVMAGDADVWLNPGQAVSMADVMRENPRFMLSRPVQRGEVYNNNARATEGGGSDFWESGVVYPDIILRDMVKIFHPEELPAHELYYYRKLQ